MMSAEQAISLGYAAFQRKDYDEARTHLSGVEHAQAIHLLGLVEKAAGNYDAAKTHLEKAESLDPSNHEILNNHGLLARLMGHFDFARYKFEQAIAHKRDFRSARISLARTLNTLGRHQEAMAGFAFLVGINGHDLEARIGYANAALDLSELDIAKEQIDAALALDPENRAAHFAGAVLSFNMGDIDKAETVFRDMIAAGEHVAQANFMMARVKLYACDIAGARKCAEISYEHAPANRTFQTLADIYWTSGDKVAFDALLTKGLSRPELVFDAIALRRSAGGAAQALALLETQPEEVRASSPFQSLRSEILLDLGDVSGAVKAGRNAGSDPDRTEIDFNLVRALLASGDAQSALPLIRQARDRNPLDQFCLGYEATALRMLGDPQYNQLIDYDRHIQASLLPVPDGFATLDGFNEAFSQLLEDMTPFSTGPLNLSLRGGAQSLPILTLMQHPLLAAYFEALRQPINDYMNLLGQSPDHPTSARNTGHYKFSSCWSVRQRGGGHHVNHLHPRGWISSAYYVTVPPASGATDDKAGWLKFGEPPIATNPELGPEKWVKPEPGMVVLFPSFLWHGTEPIHDGGVRVTAPFDVVPVKAP